MKLENRPRRLRSLVRLMVPIFVAYILLGFWVDYRTNRIINNPELIEKQFFLTSDTVETQKISGFYEQSRPLDYLIFSRRIIVNHEYAPSGIPTGIRTDTYEMYVSPFGILADQINHSPNRHIPSRRILLATSAVSFFLVVAIFVMLFEKKKLKSDKVLADEATSNQAS